MYDPKFRMAVLISFGVCLFSLVSVFLKYVLGNEVFDPVMYVRGVSSVGGAVVGGFFFVLVCTKFITFERLKRTGFEATFRDETGTGFNFPVSLSKYLPDIIAPPAETGLHPVEAELLGFLNAFREWPFDITGEDRDSLYQHTYKQWQAIRQLDNISAPHCIAALGQNVGKTFAYKESRRYPPTWQFWKKAHAVYSRRCIEHGGLSAFIMGTMPSFSMMDERTRRAILTAVRYRDNPTMIPANCDPLTLEIYEALHLAAQKVREAEGDEAKTFNADSTDLAQLENEIQAFFQAVIRSLEVNPLNQSSKSDGIYLGDGVLVLKTSRLIQAFSPTLSPYIRRRFRMWRLDGKPHPCWQAFITTFRDMGLLQDTFHNTGSDNGLFNLKVGDQDYPNSIILKIDLVKQLDLRNNLDALPRFPGLIEVVRDERSILAEIKQKAAQMDKLLAEARSTYS